MLNMTSPTVPMSVLDDYAETMIAPRIAMVNGVSQVQVQGASKYAVRVQIDPDKLHAQHIGINEIDQALQNWNVNTPTGQLFGPTSTYNIKAAGQLNNAAAFRPIVLGYRDGAPVRLEQVANVIDSIENVFNGSWYYSKENGKPRQQRAITLQVLRQPGSNTIEVTDAVRALLPAFDALLPPSVHMSVRQDRSRNIRNAFKDIQVTMLVTLVLVVGVIFMFLHNGSATLIPALALPFSILGTFAVMKVLNFSLNNLSMMALILSIGFVVDDAIVMLENIVRHMENGRGAARSGAQGLEGNRLHDRHDDHVARGGVHPDSLHERDSRPAVPRVRRDDHGGRAHLGRRLGDADADAVQPVPEGRPQQEGLRRADGPGVRRPAGRLRVEPRLGAALPGRDAGAVRRRRSSRPCRCTTSCRRDSFPTGTTIRCSSTCGRRRARRITTWRSGCSRSPTSPSRIRTSIRSWRASGNQNGGGGGGGSANNGRLQIQLTPRAARPLTALQIAQQLRPQLLRFPGFRGFVNVPASIQIGGRQGNQNYSIMLQSLNTDELYEWAPQARAGHRPAGARGAGSLHRPRDEEPADQPGDGSRSGGRRSA